MAFTTTPEFRAALRATDQRLALRAEVYRGVEKVLDLQPVDGSVDVDGDNAFRRRCKVTLVDPTGTLTPRAATDALTPYGNELRLFRGLTTVRSVVRNADRRRALVTYTVGNPRLPARLAALGYDVTTIVGASAAVMKQYDVVVQDGSHFAWNSGGNAAGVVEAYAAGVSVLTIGNDSTSVGPLASAATTLGGALPGLITPRNTWHPLGAAWPTAGVSNSDDRTYLRGLADSTVVFAAYPPGADAVERAVGIAGQNAELGRWAHLNTIAAPNSVLDAMITWVMEPRSETRTTDTLIPLGVFGIADVDVEDTGSGLKITVDGFDRARKVSRASFTDVYTVPAGTNYATAIRDLINSRVPGLQYAFDIFTSVTPLLVFDAGDDPWKRAQDMADNVGADLFFDVEGVCTLRRRVSSTTPAWEFTEGAGALILEVSNRTQDEQAYNTVVVTGEAGDGNAPVRAIAQDTLAASPTRVSGPYGTVVRFFSSQFITTQAQAQAVADALLARSLGLTERVSLTAIPVPQLDAGDTVRVRRGRVKVDDLYVIDALSIPLNPAGTMGVTTRKRRV